MSEDNVKKMAKLLREGATMLNLYCPQCNGILFRNKKDNIFCPNCNKSILIDSSEKSAKQPKLVNEVKLQDYTNLKSQLYHLVQKLTNRLEDEDDLLIISRILEILKQVLAVIESLKNI